MAKDYTLANQHTKTLMAWLEKARKMGQSGYAPGSEYGPYFTVSEIKSELGGREHILNKDERKELFTPKQKRGLKYDRNGRIEEKV